MFQVRLFFFIACLIELYFFDFESIKVYSKLYSACTVRLSTCLRWWVCIRVCVCICDDRDGDDDNNDDGNADCYRRKSKKHKDAKSEQEVNWSVHIFPHWSTLQTGKAYWVKKLKKINHALKSAIHKQCYNALQASVEAHIPQSWSIFSMVSLQIVASRWQRSWPLQPKLRIDIK